MNEDSTITLFQQGSILNISLIPIALIHGFSIGFTSHKNFLLAVKLQYYSMDF